MLQKKNPLERLEVKAFCDRAPPCCGKEARVRMSGGGGIDILQHQVDTGEETLE